MGKMATIIKYAGADANLLYNDIRAKCSVQLKDGCEYIYNHETKTIEDEPTRDDVVVVCCIVKHTPQELLAAVPYEVGRTLSCSVPRAPISVPSINAVFKGSLRDYQADGAQRVIKMLKETGRCYMQAPPAYGKTVIMSYVISEIREPTLIVTSRISLAQQTKTSVEEMLEGVKAHILDLDKEVPADVDILISFTRRLNGPSAPYTRFKTVVFDEVHELSTRLGIAALLTVRPNHLLALTATPGDRNKITELFVGKCEIEELGTKRWSVCFPRIMSDLNGAEYSGMDGYNDAMGDLCKSIPFVSTVARMIAYFVGLGKRIIALTIRTDMGVNLARTLDPYHISYSVLTPDNRVCKPCDVIIGTNKLIGTGFDLKNYMTDYDDKPADVMVFLGSFKNATMWYQSAGRGFRSNYPLAIFPGIVGLPVSDTHLAKLKTAAYKTKGCVILQKYSAFLERFNPVIDRPGAYSRESRSAGAGPTEGALSKGRMRPASHGTGRLAPLDEQRVPVDHTVSEASSAAVPQVATSGVGAAQSGKGALVRGDGNASASDKAARRAQIARWIRNRVSTA
jgi:hypothetical protein